MARTGRGSTRQRQIFNSVFGSSLKAISEPTPHTTPATAFVAPGNPIGLLSRPDLNFDHRETSVGASTAAGDFVEDQVTWDRSWHVVTSTFRIASLNFQPHDTESSATLRAARPSNFYAALDNVVSPSKRLPYATKTDDIATWTIQHARAHFLDVVTPWLLVAAEHEIGESLLKMTFDALQRARDHYLDLTSDIVAYLSKENPSSGKMFADKLDREFQTLARSCLPEPTWGSMKWYLSHSIRKILAVPDDDEEVPMVADGQQQEAARLDLMNFLGMLRKSGLAGERFQILFAEAMNGSMSAFVHYRYKALWDGKRSAANTAKTRRKLSRQLRDSLTGDVSNIGDEELVPRVVNHAQASRCVEDVCTWTENMYARLAVEVLSATDSDEVTYDDLQRWKGMSIGRLASLRTSELFDIVVSWPNGNGALDDLRTAITTPQDRLLLTEAFTQQLKTRLLHPGASTLQILRTYISMIRSFHALDHSKVLLDRVAFPLQLYLCSREDTARVVIAGLLADTKDEEGNDITTDGDKLIELAILLHQGPDMDEGPDAELDWNDMTWVPDPVDAGPGYKRSRSVDVIGTLINVLGSQDIFTKEFQKILGEHLLKNNDDFQNEVIVLELLKARFGEDDLQSQEVMLKDIYDSRNLDEIIGEEQGLCDPPEEGQTGPPAVHSKMLSRVFWPQIDDEKYVIPDVVSKELEAYEAGFEKLKAARKLTWLHALGQATIEIDLKDRTITDEVMTFQATVIYAFQSEGYEPATRTFESLHESLQMDEDLLRSALKFWIGKMVLQETGPDQYTVLETLSREQRDRSDAAMAEAAADDAGEEAVRETKMSDAEMALYWSFVQAMLKNSAAQMPVAQIGMMLKMLIAEGFPYSDPELAEYLNAKVEGGDLELNAGKYRLVKK